MVISPVGFEVPAEEEAAVVAEEKAEVEDTVPLKDVQVTSAGAVRKNVKKMVVKADKAAMEAEVDQEKDTVGLEVLGNKWVEMSIKKVVKAVKAEKDVEQDQAVKVVTEVKEATSVAMDQAEEKDKKEKTAESKRADAVSEATAMEEMGKMVAAVAVLVTLPPVTVEDFVSLNPQSVVL